MKTRQIKYKFFATLLDAFRNYLQSDAIYEKYWGFSDEPPHTQDEFKVEQFQNLINTINRVPFDSEAADKGTAFNEIVDCIVLHKKSEKIDVSYVTDETGKKIGLQAVYNERTFQFPIELCLEVSRYFREAIPQQYVEAILPTRFGEVLLYGYIDYVAPFCTHDLKTTSSYSVGKYRDHAQHLVYPYCLWKNGADVELFEYNVVELGKKMWQTYTETYTFVPDRDVPRLTTWVEDLIDFIEEHRDLITNKKIFNLE